MLVRRRGVGTLQGHVPALAIFARPSREHDLEAQSVDVPRMARGVCTQRNVIRLEKIFGRVVRAVLVLDSAIQREFVIRAHVQLEWTEAGPLAVIDALAVLAVALAAGLPVAFEQRARVITEGPELRVAQRRHTETGRDHESCNEVPLRAPAGHLLQPPVRVSAKTRPDFVLELASIYRQDARLLL